MGKLHELLAVLDDLSGQCNKMIQETMSVFGNNSYVTGFKRFYRSLLESDAEALPPEEKIMQTTVPDRVAYTLKSLGRMIDASLSKEVTNQQATADLTIDGQKIVILPAQALLNLEAKFKLLRDVVGRAPTLDAAVRWDLDINQAHVYRSPEEVKERTKKIEDYQVIVPPTKEHPAQVVKTVTDKRVGEWVTTQFSGEISAVTKSRWLTNIDRVLMAVKQARCRANMAEVVEIKVADQLFGIVFGGDLPKE